MAMKKNIFKIAMTWFALVIMTGCADYLNEPKPTTSVDEGLIYSSREAAEAHLAGITRLSRAVYNSVSSANLSTIYCARSLKGNDFISIPGNALYRSDYDYTDLFENGIRSWFTWVFMYDVIQQINVFINGVTNSETISSLDKTQLLGQARTWRAYCYFELSLEFNLTYQKDPEALAPPIYLEVTAEGKPMSTLNQIYNEVIIPDLQFAVDNLDETRLVKSFINVHVAEGLLARVYQVTGNWPLAEEMAHRAYGGFVNNALAASSYIDGFDDFTNTEWIWGMQNTTDQTASWYISPSTISDHVNGYYKSLFVNANFVNQFSATDVRNTFFEVNNVTDYRQYATTKFTFDFESDMVLMRTAEMILIEAEAMFRNNKAADAHNLLFALQYNRDPSAVKSSNTGDALMEEILLERRKELYLEFGVEWYDAKRLQRGITRDAKHSIIVNLVPNDPRFVVYVPLEELNSNPNIDESVNQRWQ